MASLSEQALVGRVTPVRAVGESGRRRPKDCPPYHYSNRMRLTACRSVSCYRVSVGRIALVGRVL
jgi:hypothetical protein